MLFFVRPLYNLPIAIDYVCGKSEPRMQLQKQLW